MLRFVRVLTQFGGSLRMVLLDGVQPTARIDDGAANVDTRDELSLFIVPGDAEGPASTDT